MLGIGYFVSISDEVSQSEKPPIIPPSGTVLVPPLPSSPSNQHLSLNLTPQDLSRLSITNSDLAEVNEETDRRFRARYPEFRNKQIDKGDRQSVLEWHRTRRCDVLVDHLFMKKNPHMQGKQITDKQPELREEWFQIRKQVGQCTN